MAAHLLFKLGQFRKNGEFIDVRLKVDESIFPAHRNVLAANSDYFHAMFTNGMKESNQEVIELKDENISALGFKIVMDSIYSGELFINKKNVFEVLTTANHLQMPTIGRKCCDFLDKEYIQGYIDIQTYLHLHAFADLHGLRDLKEDVQRKMALLYSQVSESEEFLSLIDADQLLNLLSRDDLNAPSETFVFKSVMQWIKHKKKERMPVAAKVIGAVRLGLVDTKDVVEELNTEEMQRVREIQMLMYEKLLHSNMPSSDSKFAVEKTRPRSTIPVLVAIFPVRRRALQKKEDSLATEVKYFHAETSSWKPFPSMARLVDVTKCICAEVVGNYLYVAVEPAERGSHIMYRYDTVRNVWEKLPRFQNDISFRVDCMSSVNEYIYVISGSGLLQRYSLAQNDWQSGSNLPFFNNTDDDQEKLVFVTAVSMRSKIYVLHGCYIMTEGKDNYGRLSLGMNPKPAVVHCFDPLRNVWRKMASTRYPHFKSNLFVDKNNLYVAGGSATISNGSQMNRVASTGDAPVEVYNEETNSWCVVEQNRIPSNALGAVELLGGEVYFMINKFPIDSGIRIPPNEVYKISLREWENSLERIDRTAVLCNLSVNKEMLSTVKAAAEYPAETKSP